MALLAFLWFSAFILPHCAAHMSAFLPSMYGLGRTYTYDAGDPVNPIGPDFQLNDWWFRGPAARALTPAGRKDNIAILPAGKTLEVDITCHAAWAGLGWRTTRPGSHLDACPDNPGAYHFGESPLPATSGCALAIADVDDIEKTNMDNLVIFSVVKDCVKQKENVFQIPKAMPKCTGKKCICAWFWLADQGLTNFYMTAFDCSVTGSLPDATPIAPPSDPVFCLPSNSSCSPTKGAKRPLYAYNKPTNVAWKGNENRPGYHDSWSFFDGAQNDIFLPPGGSIGGVPVARINGVPTGSNIVANSTISLPPPPPVESSGPISSIPSYSPSPRQPSQQAPSSRSTSTRHVATLAVSLSSTTPTPSSTVTSQKTQLARLAQASSDSYDEESASILYPLQPATISDTTSAPPARPTTSQDTLRITTRPKKEIGLEGLGEGYGPATTTSTTERSAASPTTTSSSPPRHSPPPSPPSPAVVSSLAGAAPSPPLPSSTTAPLPDTLRADNPLARVNLVSSALGGRNGDFFVPFFCAGFALVFVL